jgi:hypothetical protein
MPSAQLLRMAFSLVGLAMVKGPNCKGKGISEDLMMMLSFAFKMNEFMIGVFSIVPILILIFGRDAIKLDKKNLLRPD